MYNRIFPLPASKIIQRFRVVLVMTTSMPLHSISFAFFPADRALKPKEAKYSLCICCNQFRSACACTVLKLSKSEWSSCNLASIHYFCLIIKCSVLNRLYIDSHCWRQTFYSARHSISCLSALFKLRYSPKYMQKMLNRYWQRRPKNVKLYSQ